MTRAGGEEKAEHALLGQGAEVYLPRYDKLIKSRHVRGRNAKKRFVETVPLFPAYLFARLDGAGVVKARGLDEVHGLLMSNGEAVTVRESVIDEIRHLCETGAYDDLCNIRLYAGDQVLIVAGLYGGYIGTVVQQPKSKSKIHVEIGRLKVVGTLDILRKLADQKGVRTPA